MTRPSDPGNFSKDGGVPYTPDLPGDAHAAIDDYYRELRRQDVDVRVTDPHVEAPDDVEFKDTGMQNKKKIAYRQGEAPIMAFVRSLGIDAMVASEVAELLNISPNTVRKWAKDPSLKAPSFRAAYGKGYVFLYTPEDVEELRTFMAKRWNVESTGGSDV